MSQLQRKVSEVQVYLPAVQRREPCYVNLSDAQAMCFSDYSIWLLEESGCRAAAYKKTKFDRADVEVMVGHSGVSDYTSSQRIEP